ncbi:MAG: hypothetical protein IKT07_04245 [Oscillospiraceae bacterium]|nr:hypothetical protein [Oscillospiraceae bacterium]
MKTVSKRMISALLALLMMMCLALNVAADAPAESSGVIDTEKLDAWIKEYVADHQLTSDWQIFSVGFCWLDTGDTWYYDADQWMYSASLYKVPVSMLAAEKEAAGELTPDSSIKGMTLEYVESTALTYSNNDSGHALVDYLGGTYSGKCSDMTIPYTKLPESYFEQNFYDYSYYTARYMTHIMRTLYEGGEERFPHVIEYLLPATKDAYFEISVKEYEVAQKYGSFEEKNGNKNEHCSAIIYTPCPIVVTVMTRNVGDYQARISEVGRYLTDYAVELQAELASQPPEPEVTPALAEDVAAVETPTVSEQEQQAPSAVAGQNEAPAAAAAADSAPTTRRDRLISVALILCAVIIGLIVAVAVIGLLRKKRAEQEEEPDPEWMVPPSAKEETPTEKKAHRSAVKEDNTGYRPRH